MSIEERLDEVRLRIDEAAQRSGRAPDSVRLVAVTKTKPTRDLREALAAGCADFGENYVQELVAKADELAGEGARFHFIGRLQRNKVKTVLEVPGLVLIHGVDSLRLIEALGQRATHPIDVLIQVNVSGEEQKGGCHPDDLPALLEGARAFGHLSVRGLMTVPPIGEAESSRPHFQRLRELRDRQAAALPELSMGMSHDFEVAIEEGATLVRVGSAIFGSRS